MKNDETKFPSTDISAARIEEANNLHKQFVKIMKKGAQYAFEIGTILFDIQLRDEEASYSWPEWCENNLIFDVSTANKYLRIYNNFKDNPKLLADQTITGALKLLSSPQKEKEELTQYGQTDKRPETSWEQYFEIPPLGRKVTLNNYRFEQPNAHELYLIRRGLDYPVKIVEVLAPGSDDGQLKTAHKGMMENVQIALETYFQEVERIESLQGGKK
jgi:hypothetical protein